MARISKHLLPPDDLHKLFDQLSAITSRLTPTTADAFLNELLGPEEKIMLTKRLAAIVMYTKGYSSYRVWVTLKLSPATAATIQDRYQRGEYTHIQKILTVHKADYKKFWNVLEVILSGGLPPIVGPGRWGNNPAVKGSRRNKK